MTSSTVNIHQILQEAKGLASRLQQDDKTTDWLITSAQAVTEKINCLKEYKEIISDLHEMRIAQRPRSVLVHSLQQENRQIKILQEENKQLKAALEEHQATIDIIMSRYRQQMVRFVELNKFQHLASEAVDSMKELDRLVKAQYVYDAEFDRLSKEIDQPDELDVIAGYAGQSQFDKFSKKLGQREEFDVIARYASQFDQCLKKGEKASLKDQEEIARLTSENQLLRRLLKIADKYHSAFSDDLDSSVNALFKEKVCETAGGCNEKSAKNFAENSTKM